jgi:hypothetical protein
MRKVDLPMSSSRILPPGVVLPPLASTDAHSKRNRSEGASDQQASNGHEHDRGVSEHSEAKITQGLQGTEGNRKGQSQRAKPGRFGVLNQFVDVTMRGLSDRAVRAWIVLYRDTKPNERVRTGYSDLARRMGCSISTVKRAIRELRQRGLVTVTRRGGPAVGPNEYRVVGGPTPSVQREMGNRKTRKLATG